MKGTAQKEKQYTKQHKNNKKHGIHKTENKSTKQNKHERILKMSSN